MVRPQVLRKIEAPHTRRHPAAQITSFQNSEIRFHSYAKQSASESRSPAISPGIETCAANAVTYAT